jgi:hypothetical protein
LKRRNRSDPVDRERRSNIEAAVRHAERMVRNLDTAQPVVFRPDTRSVAVRSFGGTSPIKRSVVAPINSAMEDALRSALGIPSVAPIQSPATSNSSGMPKASMAGNKAPINSKPPLRSTPPKHKRPKRSKAQKAPNSCATIPKLSKRKKTKMPPAMPARPSLKVTSKITADGRRLGVAKNAATRLAFNARQRDAASAAPRTVSSFHDLKVRWQRSFIYLQRFGDNNPDTPDVAAALERLLAIEAEWARRASMAPDHPDYFPWPTTDAPQGSKDVAVRDWEEIGMLSYLGYHVRMKDELSAAQRRRLLAHVFNMRLPPLNSVAYMRSWGSPNTGPRLKKIAESIAAFTRNTKRRRNPQLAEAIRKWEEDLLYLRKAFYVDRFDSFIWPTV